MKASTLLIMACFFLTFVACEREYEEPPVTEETVAAPQAEVQTFQADLDARLSEFDQRISELEAQPGIDSTDLAQVREEREDIVELRQEAAQAQSVEEFQETRRKMWEEFRDLDVLLTEARLEAAEDREAFQTAVSTEMEEFDRRIQELENDATGLDAEARQEYDQQIADLRQERDELQQRLDELGETTEENWESVRADIVQGWNDLKASFYSHRINLHDAHRNVETETEETETM